MFEISSSPVRAVIVTRAVMSVPCVRDEDLGAVDDPRAVTQLGGRARGARIGAGAGLGQAERGQPLSRCEGRQQLRALLVAAEEEDRHRAERGVSGDGDRDGGVDAGELLDRDRVRDGVAAGAAELLGEGNAHQPELGHLGDELVREARLAVELLGDGRDTLRRERPHRVPDQLVLGREIEIHTIDRSPGSRRAACERPRTSAGASRYCRAHGGSRRVSGRTPVRERVSSASRRLDSRAMVALSGGHLATDFASGAVPALLPFIALEFGLGYAAAAMLLLSVTISSSIVQPLFGLWSDRVGALWLIPGGVLLSGAGVGLAAVAPSYALVLVLVFLAGIGSAAFHPEGAKFAHYASGPKRASGMSYFNVGGNSGYALGAIVTTPLVVWLGLVGGLIAVVPVVAAGFALLRVLPRLRRLRPAGDGAGHLPGVDRPRAMILLGAVIVLRSVAWFALLAFVPLWLVSLGQTEAEGNRMLSLMLVAGATGTLLLGPVADRIGLRRTLVLTQAALAAADARLRVRRRRRRSGGPDARRRMRRRDVRGDDGHESALPAATRRCRVGPLDRPRDGARRRGRRGARRGRGRRRPRDGVDGQRDRSRARCRAVPAPAGAGRGAARRRRAGRSVGRLASTDRSISRRRF